MDNHGTATSDNKDTEERTEATQNKNSNSSDEISSFKFFSESDIMKATDDLSESSRIGRGGFGSVYRGTIADAEVAIKILDPKSTQGANEFVQEMAVLKGMKHENLVKLLGACLELRSLVYEYVPNGSIEDCLINRPELLTWKIRIRIVCEICSALTFMHLTEPKPLVHGDLKPHNILLDANLQCKLADFGLSRFLPEFSDTSGAFLVTKNINGTEWYIDPNYLLSGKLTPGSDVYSLGVTTLRILTGRPPHYLYKMVRKACRSKSLMEMVDATAGDWPVDIAEYLGNFGVSCCKDNKNSLKLMTDISMYLKKRLAEIPHQPPFSPIGNAYYKMDLTAIHEILVSTHYRDDEGITELSFQEWTREARDALEIRKLGDFAFRDKDFKQAIEYYSQFMDARISVSPTVYIRRSLCHLMCDDDEAALRHAMQAQSLHPGWPTVFYMQALALSRLNMGSDATDMLNEAAKLEARRKYEIFTL